MPLSLTRRQLITGAAGLLGAAALGDGFLVEPGALAVARQDLPIAGLAPGLQGLRIAVASDVHLHDGISNVANATLAALERERPEVVLLVGDICNTRDDLGTLVSWARRARGTRATFATLGNWEHDAGIDRRAAEQACAAAGVELLYNSSARVAGPGGAALTIVGIDDPVLGEPDVAAAVRDVDATRPAIWAVHAPGYVDGIPRDRFPRPAAILAGHTHGGQVRL